MFKKTHIGPKRSDTRRLGLFFADCWYQCWSRCWCWFRSCSCKCKWRLVQSKNEEEKNAPLWDRDTQVLSPRALGTPFVLKLIKESIKHSQYNGETRKKILTLCPNDAYCIVWAHYCRSCLYNVDRTCRNHYYIRKNTKKTHLRPEQCVSSRVVWALSRGSEMAAVVGYCC